jgi:hypothetical protein
LLLTGRQVATVVAVDVAPLFRSCGSLLRHSLDGNFKKKFFFWSEEI